MGDTQYTVRTNATPASINDLNMMPVKFVNGATILLKDVAQVRDGSMVQQNIVRDNGRRSVLLSVIKNGNASTLAVVNGVKKAIEVARRTAPAGLKISELFDQSVFVTSSVKGVLREGAIAVGLTAPWVALALVRRPGFATSRLFVGWNLLAQDVLQCEVKGKCGVLKWYGAN